MIAGTDRPDNVGRPGEVGRPSACVSCYVEVVPSGEKECAFCRSLGDDPPFGWRRDLREFWAERADVGGES